MLLAQLADVNRKWVECFWCLELKLKSHTHVNIKSHTHVNIRVHTSLRSKSKSIAEWRDRSRPKKKHSLHSRRVLYVEKYKESFKVNVLSFWGEWQDFIWGIGIWREDEIVQVNISKMSRRDKNDSDNIQFTLWVILVKTLRGGLCV